MAVTTRRAALGLLGTASIAATGTLPAAAAPPAAVGRESPPRAVPKGLRPGGEVDQQLAEQTAEDVFSGSILITYRGRTVWTAPTSTPCRNGAPIPGSPIPTRARPGQRSG